MNNKMLGILGLYGAALSMMSDNRSMYTDGNKRRVSVENLSDETKILLKQRNDRNKIDAKNKHLKKFEISGEIYYGCNYESAYKKYKKHI